jgi:diaminopimelate epimerase
MTIPFFKMQVAGNGFALVDADQPKDPKERLPPDRYADASRAICDRRYGVGASGVIFLSADNTIRILNASGAMVGSAGDALLCAARYAFDSGRVKNRLISFRNQTGDVSVAILGAHDFRVNLGSPFSLLDHRVVDPTAASVIESLEQDGVRSSCAALHVGDDVVVALPDGMGVLNYAGFNALVQKAFPGRQVIPVVARCVTRETILARAAVKRPSGSCAAAAAALVTAISAGNCEKDAVVMFEPPGSDGAIDDAIAKDRDASRRLLVSWDRAENDVLVTGTGGYVFEGKFDFT